MKYKSFQSLVIFLICQNVCAFHESLDSSIIGDFFSLKHIKNGLIFGCGQQYNMVHLMKKINQKHYLSLAIENIDHANFENENYTKNIFNTLVKTTSFHSGIILYDNCKNTMTILRAASELEFFDETHKWLIISEDYDKIKEKLNSTLLRLDSEVLFVLRKKSLHEFWLVYDAYNPGKEFGGKLNVTFYGFWRSSNLNDAKYVNENDNTTALFKTDENYKIVNNWLIYLYENKMRSRMNLDGITITSIIAIAYKPPKGGFMRYLSVPTLSHVDSMHRYTYTLFVHMMDMFNFKLKLIRTNTWGTYTNGTYTGVFGALLTGRAEIAITPSQFKSHRFTIVDQTAVCWLGRASLIFKHPKGTGLRDNFVKPLTMNVWWATLATLIGATVMFKLMLRQEAKALNFNDDVNAAEANDDNSWSYVIFVAITGEFCQQGLPHTPYMPSGRTLSLITLLFTFMLFQFYSASIVSSLLMEPLRTITNLETLTKSKLKIIIEDISYNYDFFQESPNPLVQHLYKNVFLPRGLKNVFVSPEAGLKKVNQGGYAFQVDVSLAYKLIPECFSERSICDLSEIPLFPPKPIMPLLRKGSPYRQIITLGLRKMEENGIMSYQKSVWHAKKPKCSLGGASEPVSVTIEETASAFVMLTLSLIISVLILVFETALNNYFKNRYGNVNNFSRINLSKF